MRKLIVLFLLAVACNKAEAPLTSDVASTSAAAPDATRARTVAAPDAKGAQTFAAIAQPSLPRMIVRTAEMKIVVADTAKAVDAVVKSAEAAGGFVSDSSVWREGELLRARLTLRVPSPRLTSTLASIRGAAKRVENETIRSEDVTQEFVDLGSQLKNFEATEIELRALLVTIRQNARKAADVLEVHEQLTMIRGEIERTKGRMQYLGQITSLATIALDITPDALAQPLVQAGWQPLAIVKNAGRALVISLQTLATAVIWFVIYLLPVFVLFALVVLALWKVYRRARTRAA